MVNPWTNSLYIREDLLFLAFTLMCPILNYIYSVDIDRYIDIDIDEVEVERVYYNNLL